MTTWMIYWQVSVVLLCLMLGVIRWKRDAFSDEPAGLLAVLVAFLSILWPLAILTLLIKALVKPTASKDVTDKL